jgi:hypothetical protein
MSHFLWIEDFESDIRTTVDQVFGLAGCPTTLRTLKPWLKERGVILKTTFFEALLFVRSPERLEAIDYVVIDIDLKPYEDYDLDDPESVGEIHRFLKERRYLSEPADLAQPFGPGWSTAVSELKKVAGYHIFTELLIDAGFPKHHILFCSNHGDQLTSISRAFESAKLTPPRIYTKRDPFVQGWTTEKALDAYSVLRRGILLGCDAAAQSLDLVGNEETVFCRFFKREDEPDWPPGPTTPGYLRDYLTNLSVLLPLRAPGSTQERKQRYRIFVHVLGKEWDKRAKVAHLLDRTDPIATYGTIMKEVRNWTSHTQLLDDLSEADVAYIFMVNLRAMFRIPQDAQPHEHLLLGLLGRAFGCLSAEDTGEIVGYDMEDRRIPLDGVYFELKRTLEDLRGTDETDRHFDQLVRDLQREIGTQGDFWDGGFFLQSLYRMFWYYPSRMRRPKYGWVPGEAPGNASLFRHYDFGRNHPESFLFQLARRILLRSFPDSFAEPRGA